MNNDIPDNDLIKTFPRHELEAFLRDADRPTCPERYDVIEAELARRDRAGDRYSLPYIQYVGAWGLLFLINTGVYFLLAFVLRKYDLDLRGPLASVLFLVGLMLTTLLTFCCAVKIMITDDLKKKFKAHLEALAEEEEKKS